MKKIFVLLLSATINQAGAQIISQFANSVISFSSEYTNTSWSAQQATGTPNSNHCFDDLRAWASSTANSQPEFIELGFVTPQPVNRINIHEAMGAGGITQISLRNASNGVWNIVYTGVAASAGCYRILGIAIPTTAFNADAIRIDIDSPAVPYWQEIDAVEIMYVNNVIQTALPGNWNDPATWTGGIIPSATDNVVIQSGHTVTLNSSASINSLDIRAGAALIANTNNNLDIGPAPGGNRFLTVSGSLTISNGMIKVGGYMLFNPGSSFNMSGGTLSVDANNGTGAGSIPDGLYTVHFQAGMSSFNFSNGTLQIVDPPFGSIGYALKSPYNFGPASTLKLGDGISTTASGNIYGFGGPTWPAQIGALVLDGTITTGNRQVFIPDPSVTMQQLTVNSGKISLQSYSNRVLGNVVNAGVMEAGYYFVVGGSVTNTSTGSIISPSRLIIGGDLTNNGVMGGGTIYMAADPGGNVITNPQTINGTGIFGTIGTLLINNSNPAGVTINAPITTSQLQLTLGRVFIGNNDFTTPSIAVFTPGNNSCIVTNGTGRVVIPDGNYSSGGVLFPVAVSSGSYDPVTITLLTAPHTFAVRVDNSITGYPSTNNVVTREWNIDHLSGTNSPANLNFQWNASNEGPGFNHSSCYVSHFTGGSWIPQQLAGPAGGSDPYSRAVSGITNFSPFAVASGGTLPVSLVNFTALRSYQSIRVDWVAENETNFSHYELEKSADGINFFPLSNVPKQNMPGRNSYSVTDASPFSGYNYYRLKMINSDGSFNYSAVVKINFTGKYSLTLFPNPATDHLYIRGISTPVWSTIYDIQGKEISRHLLQPGMTMIPVDKLQAGQYLLTVRENNNQQTIVFIKREE